jgi:hypothetical protein
MGGRAAMPARESNSWEQLQWVRGKSTTAVARCLARNIWHEMFKETIQNIKGPTNASPLLVGAGYCIVFVDQQIVRLQTTTTALLN